MNPSNAATASSSVKNSKNVTSKRDQFYSTFRRKQAWPLPDSLMYYITKNPFTPKSYEKKIQTCKYFFAKKPLLRVTKLSLFYGKNQWCTYFPNTRITLDKVCSKIWVIDDLYISRSENTVLPSVPFLVSKLLHCNYNRLFLCDLNISSNYLKLLASHGKQLELNRTLIKNVDDFIIAMEKIIEMFPNVKSFYYNPGSNTSMITSKTVYELLKLPHFLNLEKLDLYSVPEAFDIDCFYEHIKKNKKTKIQIRFCDEISAAYKARIQVSVNEILSSHYGEYKIPYLYFSGMMDLTWLKLWNLHSRSYL